MMAAVASHCHRSQSTAPGATKGHVLKRVTLLTTSFFLWIAHPPVTLKYCCDRLSLSFIRKWLFQWPQTCFVTAGSSLVFGEDSMTMRWKQINTSRMTSLLWCEEQKAPQSQQGTQDGRFSYIENWKKHPNNTHMKTWNPCRWYRQKTCEMSTVLQSNTHLWVSMEKNGASL